MREANCDVNQAGASRDERCLDTQFKVDGGGTVHWLVRSDNVAIDSWTAAIREKEAAFDLATGVRADWIDGPRQGRALKQCKMRYLLRDEGNNTDHDQKRQ